ncbi:hypothetical protein NMS86_003628 [Vibrio cholerae]|nr:hypothetical protein [Vibrio cholerae]MDG2632726.1 hypothetical protein [Vibrio parahaemolyticus]
MEYTLEEIKVIARALKEECPWSSSYVTDIKSKIKNHYLNKPLPKCCYCLRDFTGEFRLDIDIEHVLPKSIYKNCIFDLENLSVACKRCNMKLKGSDLKFLNVDLKEKYGKWKHGYFHSRYYKFIHPNLDHVYDHISFYNTRVNDVNFKKYIPNPDSSKALYTYEYFELNKLESDNLTEMQGGHITPKDTALAQQIMEVFRKNGL